MLLSRRLLIARILSVAIFLFVGVCDATAARRGVRVDFLAWSDETPIDSCPGYSFSYYVVNAENARFYTSRTLGFNEPWKSYSYCQDSIPWSEGLDTSEYLNQDVFFEDESVLAGEIGSNNSVNASQNVTARKYSYLGEFGFGYQWTFYDFPDGLTLVGYYDSAVDQSPRIKTADGTITLWSGDYDGEYFCFEGGEFIGVSDGSTYCEDQSLPETERAALVALYNSTDGANWVNNDNWLDGDPCFNSWYGVTCANGEYSESEDFAASTVTQLGLDNNGLSGSIPDELADLSGLSSLNLSYNNLTGELPEALGDLPNMFQLWLHENSLTGNIPESFGNLGSLSDLYLNGNKLTGLISHSLMNLEWTNINLKWNGLRTDDALLDSFLDDANYSDDWSATQTIPPANLVVTAVGPTSISLSWDTIEYTGDIGRYRVLYSTSPSGPFSDGGVTDSKLDTTHTLTGLESGVPYYVIVRSETDSHDSNQNEIVSEDSELLNSAQILANGFE
jgi:hypothetical protein